MFPFCVKHHNENINYRLCKLSLYILCLVGNGRIVLTFSGAGCSRSLGKEGGGDACSSRVPDSTALLSSLLSVPLAAPYLVFLFEPEWPVMVKAHHHCGSFLCFTSCVDMTLQPRATVTVLLYAEGTRRI